MVKKIEREANLKVIEEEPEEDFIQQPIADMTPPVLTQLPESNTVEKEKNLHIQNEPMKKMFVLT